MLLTKSQISLSRDLGHPFLVASEDFETIQPIDHVRSDIITKFRVWIESVSN